MEDTLELVEIDTADNQEELDEKEIGYILSYNSFDREYGYTNAGGAGTNGYVYTEEDNRKNSEDKKKYYEETAEDVDFKDKKTLKIIALTSMTGKAAESAGELSNIVVDAINNVVDQQNGKLIVDQDNIKLEKKTRWIS